MLRPVLLAALCLALAGCGEPVPGGNAQVDNGSAADSGLSTPEPVAVRVGELGPNFAACSAAGTTRHLEPGQPLVVRSAPFDNGTVSGSVAPSARFFICTRSIDQKWLGIVYDSDGALSARCRVSEPVASRGAYAGPCASGWVSTPFVKMIAGDEPQPAAQASPETAQK